MIELTKEVAGEVVVPDNLHDGSPIPVVTPLQGVNEIQPENQWTGELTVSLGVEESGQGPGRGSSLSLLNLGLDDQVKGLGVKGDHLYEIQGAFIVKVLGAFDRIDVAGLKVNGIQRSTSPRHLISPMCTFCLRRKR